MRGVAEYADPLDVGARLSCLAGVSTEIVEGSHDGLGGRHAGERDDECCDDQNSFHCFLLVFRTLGCGVRPLRVQHSCQSSETTELFPKNPGTQRVTLIRISQIVTKTATYEIRLNEDNPEMPKNEGGTTAQPSEIVERAEDLSPPVGFHGDYSPAVSGRNRKSWTRRLS